MGLRTPLLLLALVSMSLAGCLDFGDDEPVQDAGDNADQADPGDTGVADGNTTDDGADDGGNATTSDGNMTDGNATTGDGNMTDGNATTDDNVTVTYEAVEILNETFRATSAERANFTITIPADAVEMTIWIQVDEGVWDEFTVSGLGDCDDVAMGSNGLVVSAATDNGSGGTTCTPPGFGDVSFDLGPGTGAAQGAVTISVMVPEA